MRTLIRDIGVALTGARNERGPMRTWDELGLLRCAAVVVEGPDEQGKDRVAWIGPEAELPSGLSFDVTRSASRRTLMPGFVDAHTHLVFGGDRSDEFVRRLAGATYQEIAAEGGGIRRTVRETRAATEDSLVASALARVDEMRRWGVRLIEIKTGYGLSVRDELRMLDVIEEVAHRRRGDVEIVATAMPLHAVPEELAGDAGAYVDRGVAEILPAMCAHGPRPRFFDVFIEKGYFDVDQATRAWTVAKASGLALKAHVDEFEAIGGLDWALAQGATSVEHLLATEGDALRRLAASDTVAVLLPATSYFLRERFAKARALVNAGALVALATDCNPGSSHTTNLPLAMHLAVMNAGLTPQEAIRAVTSGGARAIGNPFGYRGPLAMGEPFVATFLDVAHPDDLFYNLGAPPMTFNPEAV